MTATATPTEGTGATARVMRELDHARKSPTHREIVIPPCPELLRDLRQALRGPEPDLQAVARIAASDVAMAATLLRNANSARFAAGQPMAAASASGVHTNVGRRHVSGAMRSGTVGRAMAAL